MGGRGRRARERRCLASLPLPLSCQPSSAAWNQIRTPLFVDLEYAQKGERAAPPSSRGVAAAAVRTPWRWRHRALQPRPFARRARASQLSSVERTANMPPSSEQEHVQSGQVSSGQSR